MKQWERIKKEVEATDEPMKLTIIWQEVKIQSMKYCNEHCPDLMVYKRDGSVMDQTLYGIEYFLESEVPEGSK